MNRDGRVGNFVPRIVRASMVFNLPTYLSLLLIYIYIYIYRRLGEKEANREIVSFRSCVRACERAGEARRSCVGEREAIRS